MMEPPVMDAERWTLEAIRREFPIKNNRAYLNNASIGPLSNPVVAAVDGFMEDVRQTGRNNYPTWCRHADGPIKERIARFLGAHRSEIAFVKNTTEGLATVANGLRWDDGDNVIISDIEYPSNVYCWMNLARRGVEVRWIKNIQGRIRPDDIADLIDEHTRVVSLSAVQFSSGFRQDLEQTGELCRDRGVLFNLDAIQWLGALRMDVSRIPVDFLSAGGHKWLLAPIGTGIFFCRREILELLDPPTVGYHSVGKHEDHMDYDLTFRPDAGRFEEALVNFPGIWGLDAAISIFLDLGMEAVEHRIQELTSQVIEGLRRKDHYDVLSPMGRGERSGIVLFRHHAMTAEEIAPRLTDAGVDLAIRAGALRVSPTFYNDEDEIGRLLEALP